MNTASISVCLTASGGAKYLEAALRSVAAQTYTKWEILVVDDGASGNVATRVQDFAFTVPQRVTYIRSEANHGLPGLRQTGIANADGEWIAFLNADDLWKPDHLTSLISASQIEDSDLIFSGAVLYDDATWTKIGLRSPKAADLAGLPVAIYSGHLSILVSAVMAKKASLLKNGAFSDEFPNGGDTEYWLRMLSQGCHLSYSGSDTCIYRQTAASRQEETAASLIESAQICERYATWKAIPRSLPRRRPASLYRNAARMLMPEKPEDAREAISQALRLDPLSPQTLGLWFRIFLKNATRQTRTRPAAAPGRP